MQRIIVLSVAIAVFGFSINCAEAAEKTAVVTACHKAADAWKAKCEIDANLPQHMDWQTCQNRAGEKHDKCDLVH
jgi:hypothetical protein